MIRRPVQSSNISSIGWEPDEEGSLTGTLEVEFRSGHVYHYADVPEHLYQALLGASSPGRYILQHISGQYDERRVSHTR